MWKRVLSAVGVICVATTMAGAQSSVLDLIEFAVPGVTASGVCSMTQNECSFGVGQNAVYEQLSCNRSDADCRSFVPDAVGWRYFWANEVMNCGSTSGVDARLFRASSDQTSELILSIIGCFSTSVTSSNEIQGIYLDAINGSALLNTRTMFGEDVIEIRGLPTLLDIIPTFQPASETLSWVTPKHPEALPSADNFQVYAGNIDDLRRDRDFTSAVPVDCAVPDVGSPAPGDYLSILDPLNPAKGKVEYAIVGVEHGGRQRFGRQSSSGILTGREPSLFSSCS